nr:sulfatase-like hydrolase/transferase [Pirellulaceae bacterium]
KFLPDVPEVRQDFADYLGEAMAFDAAVGVIINMLRDSQQLQNTAVFISGDHGAPGFPRGKCNLYDFGVQVPLIVSMPGQRRGRIVDDFVNLMDLAPTFLELGKVSIPPVMTGRSLVPVLRSAKSGWVDSTRNWVVTGRERHVATVREGNLPYPQRAIRTPEFLYIINFKPDRWPMGGPKAVTDMFTPSADALENNTFITFGDLDASPTKAWIVEHRNDPQWKKYYDYAFAKRPREELYSISADPDQMRNLANIPAMAVVKESLREQLMQELKRTADPRVTGDGSIFDKHPYSSIPYQGYGNPN